MIFFCIIIFLFYIFYSKNCKIKGGNNYIKKKCSYQSTDLNLENKNYIGKITGNISDFRDFPNNFYCKQPLRI